MSDRLALFPLPLVLHPKGRLPLRIFEARYLRMVGECGRTGRPFVVVADLGGGRLARVGCTARIVDFDTLPDGLLGIRVVGEERVRITAPRADPDGLLRAPVFSWPRPPGGAVPAEHGALVTLLRMVAGLPMQPLGLPDDRDYDDAHWVADRLAELLPGDLEARQALFEVDEGAERLARVLALFAA